MKCFTIVVLSLTTLSLAACDDSASFDEMQRQNALDRFEENMSKTQVAIDYVEQVTSILKEVIDDETAKAAIAQIDALADQRTKYNEVNLMIVSAGTEEQLQQLSDLKAELDGAKPALELEIQRIIFSGEGGTAIPKTGPMREVTRAVNVGKPERRP